MVTLSYALYPEFVLTYKFIVQLTDINIVYLILPLQKSERMPVSGLKPFQGTGCIFQTYQLRHLVVMFLEHFHQHVLMRLDFPPMKNGQTMMPEPAPLVNRHTKRQTHPPGNYRSYQPTHNIDVLRQLILDPFWGCQLHQ